MSNLNLTIHYSSPPLQELLALEDLYNQTNGVAWVWPEQYFTGIPWNFTNGVELHDPCLEVWQGIECYCLIAGEDFVYRHPDRAGSNETNMDDYSYTSYYLDDYLSNPYNQTIITNTSVTYECHVNKVNLIHYGLTGQIPLNFFRNLPYLSHLHLSGNSLSGRIFDLFPNESSSASDWSDFSGIFKHLKIFEIDTNYFSGSFPSNLFPNFLNLQVFILSYNYFTGPMPSQFFISSKETLMAVGIASNEFSGTLPSDYFDGFDQLSLISMGNTKLSGILPVSIKTLPSLLVLAVHNANFHGNLYETILKDVVWDATVLNLLLSRNSFTGTLPEGLLPSFPSLQSLNIHSNTLTGSIPEDLCSLQDLYFLNIRDNFFTGPLPDCAFPHGSFLFVDYNSFTGSIPGNYFETGEWYEFYAAKNYFSGSLPTDAPAMRTVNLIDFSYNHLVGTLPAWLLEIPSLQQLFLENNHFHGKIPTISPADFYSYYGYDDYAYGTTGHSNLLNLDLSKNQLTGSIPEELFNILPSLQSISIVSNCFEGEIPRSICNASQLMVLSFDAFRNGPCHLQRQEPSPLELRHCIFELPALTTLHLAGSDIHGSLPENVQLSGSFVNMSLSHNQLTGTIPLTFQQHAWEALDLSYNKLTGTLSEKLNVSLLSDENGYGNLRLLSNRLSGPIPSSICSSSSSQQSQGADDDSSDENQGASHNGIPHVNILNGNIFSCDSAGKALPQNDPSVSIYSCGTNSLNPLMYAWLVLFVFALIALRVLRRKPSSPSSSPTSAANPHEIQRPRTVSELSKFFVSFLGRQNESVLVGGVLELLSSLERMRGLLVVFAVTAVALLVIYVVLGSFFSSYKYRYGFIVSAAYLSGSSPAIVILVFWIVLFVAGILLLSISKHRQKKEQMKKNSNEQQDSQRHHHTATLSSRDNKNFILSVSVAFTLLIAISLLLNIAFVYSQTTYSTGIRYLCQISMSIAKLLTGKIIIPFTMDHIFNNYYRKGKDEREESMRMKLEIALSVVMNVILPCIGTLLFNINCFYNGLFPPPSIETSYSYRSCYSITLGNVCSGARWNEVSTSYQPQFQYSFQCSSALLSDYIPVYVFMLLIDTFLRPSWRYLSRVIQEQRKKKVLPVPADSQENVSEPQPPGIVPASEGVELVSLGNDPSTAAVEGNNPPEHQAVVDLESQHNPSAEGQAAGTNDPQAELEERVRKAKQSIGKIRSVPFDGAALSIHIVQYGAILLTFGIVYPPLALMICFHSFLVLSNQSSQVLDGILSILNASSLDILAIPWTFEAKQQFYERQLFLLRMSNEKMKDITDNLLELFQYLIFPVSIVFLGYFLVDIYGDEVGYVASLWIGLFFVCFLSLFFALSYSFDFLSLSIARYLLPHRTGAAAVVVSNEDQEGGDLGKSPEIVTKLPSCKDLDAVLMSQMQLAVCSMEDDALLKALDDEKEELMQLADNIAQKIIKIFVRVTARVSRLFLSR